MANPNMFSLAWGPERLGKLLQTLEGLESGERLVTVAGAGRLSFAPWSDHPWPRGLDGINHRWKAPEEPSPAEKYATAFGLDVRAFQDEISRTSGKNATTRAATDIGLQDAWGRASIEVEPPQCAVTKNGVTFYPRDIKALVSQLYFQSNRVVERRNTVRPRDIFRYGREYRHKCKPKRNEFYWVDNGGCKDIWPSMFHDVLLNTMGRFQLPVLVRFADEQAFVPIRAYRVREMRSLSINETIAEFGSSFRDRYNPSVESHGSVFTLEIDWVLSCMEDLDDDLLTMRTTLRYAFETWTRLFAREGAWLLSNASATLTPVSLEVPLPLLVEDDPASSLRSSHVFELAEAAQSCESRPETTERQLQGQPQPQPQRPRCNRLPLDVVLDQSADRVQQCHDATGYSFRSLLSMRESQLPAVCRNPDCIAVIERLRRIEYRDCVVSDEYDVVADIEKVVTSCFRFMDVPEPIYDPEPPSTTQPAVTPEQPPIAVTTLL
ncbi:hypothetical protein P43SY_010804 [Pythium insidiosum]|uniref:Uncharacterized protein n=1 Tax=Pythium insidiosum TaxID=114742 RepID=A0AAD5LRG8_PYTIN|nr:hypothetical protein P43SY_010804 [Pythium insidiosum]